jgi:hypothetical protein
MCDTTGTMISSRARHALTNMVELERYLLIPPRQKPWLMLPRRSGAPGNTPNCDVIESSVVAELVEGGFIELASTATYVVSNTGYEYYRVELKAVEAYA